MTFSPLSVGVIGLGGIARGLHIPGYRLCENVALAALCDVDPETLARVGAEEGVTRLTTDYRELLADPDIDAVSICTWPNTHHAVSMAAIAAGKHVLCEKPLAMDATQAREMRDAARSAGLVSAVGFTHRLTPAAHMAHDLISEGALGEVRQVSAVYSFGWPNVNSRPWSPYDSKALSAGGALYGLGVHIIDMVRWWTGQEITAVCAQSRTFEPRRPIEGTDDWRDVDVEDTATFLADLSGGGMATFSQSYVRTGVDFVQRIEVSGSEGALIYDQARPYDLQVCIGERMANICAGYGIYAPMWGTHHPETLFPLVPVPQVYRDAVPGARNGHPLRTFEPAFVNAIRGLDAPLLPTFEDGFRAQCVLDAVARAWEERRWVEVEGD